jgi:hypothetical protein
MYGIGGDTAANSVKLAGGWVVPLIPPSGPSSISTTAPRPLCPLWIPISLP